MRKASVVEGWKAATVGLLLVATPLSLGAAVLLAPLNTVPVPEPANLYKFVKDKQAAIRLGKALFWDMQVGSDGITACASCHFHAGADNRIRNQVSPGLLAGDNTFQTGSAPGPDTTLTLADFPFFELVNPNSRGTGGIDPNDPAVLRSVNDVVSSQGVVAHGFEAVNAGQAVDAGAIIPDAVFSRNGSNVRRVPPRNASSVINAVFNFAQFWDGRANHYFNGVNPFGNMDVNASVWINQDGLRPLNLTANPATNEYLLDNASLASQATGPALSDFEMSWQGRSWPDIGRKMLDMQPLARQEVHASDSSLAGLRHPSGMGLSTTYSAMIQNAFRDELWNSSVPPPQEGNANFSQMESNFSLFFGLAVQLYQATLVSDDAPFDRFMAGDSAALTARQLRGLVLFVSGGPLGVEGAGGGCAFCHVGAEFTVATVSTLRDPLEAGPIEVMRMNDGWFANYDLGFYNIGVRPSNEDMGRGGTVGGLPDLQGNPLPLSFSRQFALHREGKLPFPPFAEPNCVNEANIICPDNLLAVERVAVDGAFKTPGLRNVELTGPYMHNGGMSTLMQVVEFYTRGGDFHEANIANLDVGIFDINALKNDMEKKREMVDFMLSLTDERVRWERAPFDHPQLFLPHGHGDEFTGEFVLTDLMIELPAVGGAGRQAQGLPPLKPFLAENLEGADLDNFHFQPSAMSATAPTITTTPVLTATQGLSYAYRVAASDPEGGPLTFTLDSAPAGMKFNPVFDTAARIVWKPTKAQVGTQQVTVRVTDPGGLFTTQTFSIAVTGVNTAPTITTTPVLTATQGLSYAYRVAASDPEGGPLTFTLDSAPAGMKFNPVFDTAARIVWKPTKAQVGTQQVTVRATDPDGLFTTQTFSIAVAGVNSAPVAKNNAYIMIKGGTLNVAAPGLLGNDRDPDAGDTLTAANFSTPPVGTMAGNANGSFSFTPPADFTGPTSFTYRARDNHGLNSPLATVTVTVRGNKPPVALEDSATTSANTPLRINVLGNDSDPDTVLDPTNRIDPASVYIPAVAKPNMGGTATVNADGTISYTPKQGFTGIEEFMYRVRDTYSTPATSAAVLVRVTVQ